MDKVIFFILCCFATTLFAYTNTSDEKKIQPPSIGNLALPESQQPGSLLGFGENIFDKGQKQLGIAFTYFQGANINDTSAFPDFIYAISDHLSVALFLPIDLHLQEGNSNSKGIGDVVLQFEYEVYDKQTYQFSDQGTIVLNASAPTGSIYKNPATGFGGYTIFTGFTFLRLYTDWLLYTSHGVIWTIAHQGTKSGNSFLYQGGIGKNICYVKDKYIFNWLIEIFGLYTQKSRIRGRIDPNSGSNTVFIVPSLWYSTKNLTLQAGIGPPVILNLFGNQPSINFLAALSFVWTF